MNQEEDHRNLMLKALSLAEQARDEGEVPIGAIVVCDGKIIGKGYNQTEKLKDATAHAEMIAITAASNYLNSKYLRECTLYVTLEPCVMCAGACKWSQIAQIVYGAENLKGGYSHGATSILHPKTKILQGIEAKSCSHILTSFFEGKRNER